MCYLAERFYDVALFFDDVSERCMSAKYWFWDFPGLGGVGDIFESLEDYFFYIYWDLRQAAFAIDDWWDVIDETRDWFYSLYDYAYGWLTDKAKAAYVWATWALEWASEAWNKAEAIAGVIGDTFAEIVAFIKEHAEIIYQTINEYVTNVYETFVENIYNTYETIKNYITNVYETVKNYVYNTYETIQEYYNTYITEVIGVAEDWVRDFVAAALAPLTASVNLISYWFDEIQDFFNSPLDWLLDRFGDWFFGQE